MVKGLLTPGNINLYDRPVVKNADGTISTVRSISINDNGKEVLIPTVSDDGRIMDTQEAVEYYRKTGKHLGIFENPDEATAYAKELHKSQENIYKGDDMNPQMGMLSGLPIEQLMQMLQEQNQKRPMQSQGPPPMMPMQPMSAPQMTPQGQEQGPDTMGMLSKIMPMLIKGGMTGAPTSVMGSGGPLTVPAGSQINQMDPNIAMQLSGNKGLGIMGLLRGLI